jgi:hypothetical protein
MLRYQTEKLRQEQIRKNTEEGLKDLTIELKGWEDQQGFKELMAEQNKIRNGFVELSRKGMNLMSPRTTDEVMAYKAIMDAHERVKQKADVWNQQKAVYDLIMKGIEEDSKQPEQKIDAEATVKNLREVLTKHSIEDRGTLLSNAIVKKFGMEDIDKWINERKDRGPKLDVESHPITDENGNIHNITTQVRNPKKEKEIRTWWSNQYKYAPQGIKDAVKQRGEQVRGQEPEGFSDEDRLIGMAEPWYQQKFMDKQVGKGGGFDIDFGGQKQKMQPGVLAPQPKEIGSRLYSGVYEFPATTKPLIINLLSNEAEEHVGRGDPKTGSDGWKPVKPDDAGNVEATLLFYDPKKDELIFRTTQNNDKPYIRNNTEVSVKRTSVTGSDDLPIMVDGKPKKLKDVIGEKKTGVKLIGGKDFSK